MRRMPGNPKTSKWRSTPQALRKRKVVGFTLSDEARDHLDALAAARGVSKSELLEALILATPLN